MKSFWDNLSTLTALIAIMLVAVAGLSVLKTFDIQRNLVNLIVAMLLGALIASFIAVFLRTLTKNPATLKVALLGEKGSGKTVYLTVLFRELQLLGTGYISFQPYGVETIEMVNSNLNILARGEWLPSTPAGTVSVFRANAKVGSGLFMKRYTLDFGDYAGEHMGELDSKDARWLHKTEYFDYVIGADAIFLVMDSIRIIGGDRVEIECIQNRLIAAFQVLLTQKRIPIEHRIKIPICLIVMKSDLLRLKNLSENDVLERIQNLINVCKARCQSFNIFFVSSVGKLGLNESPPEVLLPRNVTEPIIWTIRNVRM